MGVQPRPSLSRAPSPSESIVRELAVVAGVGNNPDVAVTVLPGILVLTGQRQTDPVVAEMDDRVHTDPPGGGIHVVVIKIILVLQRRTQIEIEETAQPAGVVAGEPNHAEVTLLVELDVRGRPQYFPK